MSARLRTAIEQTVAEHVHVASESAATADALYDLVKGLLVTERVNSLLTAADLAATPDEWSGQDEGEPVSDEADETGEKIAAALRALANHERAKNS